MGDDIVGSGIMRFEGKQGKRMRFRTRHTEQRIGQMLKCERRIGEDEKYVVQREDKADWSGMIVWSSPSHLSYGHERTGYMSEAFHGRSFDASGVVENRWSIPHVLRSKASGILSHSNRFELSANTKIDPRPATSPTTATALYTNATLKET